MALLDATNLLVQYDRWTERGLPERGTISLLFGERMARKRKIAVLFFLAYLATYALARSIHLVVHEGAYYDGGAKKFHDHHLRMETTVSVLLPLGAPTLHVVFFPAMTAETLLWHLVRPVSTAR